jgi:hypothetical protein
MFSFYGGFPRAKAKKDVGTEDSCSCANKCQLVFCRDLTLLEKFMVMTSVKTNEFCEGEHGIGIHMQ